MAIVSLNLRHNMDSCNRNIRLGSVRVVHKQDRPVSRPRLKPKTSMDVELSKDLDLQNVSFVKKYVRTSKKSNSITTTRVPGFQKKPASSTVRPFVPIKPRSNPMSADTVGFGQLFSSTTIVNGATQSELTTIHVQTPKDKNSLNAKLKSTILLSEEMCLPKIEKDSYETKLETLEVPVETLVSENNEIQTIHIGDFSNVVQSDDPGPTTEETFIASTDSAGNCYVTVENSKTISKAQTNWASKPSRPIVTVKSSSSGVSYFGSKRGIIRYGRSRMIADTHTSIPVQEFKAQLSDTSDIIGKMDIGPTTKRLMNVLNTKGVNKLFANPGRPMGRAITSQFARHLTMTQNLRQDTFKDMELLPIGYTSTVDPSKIKRITRKRKYPEAEEYQRRLLSEQLQERFEHLVAESESMQTIFLQNDEEILPHYPDDDLILVEDSSIGLIEQDTQEEVSMLDLYPDDEDIGHIVSEDDPEITLTDAKPTIIMVHDRDRLQQSTTFTPKNIEILLAAAEKRGISRDNIQQVIFCHQTEGNFSPGDEDIMLLPENSLCEDLVGELEEDLPDTVS